MNDAWVKRSIHGKFRQTKTLVTNGKSAQYVKLVEVVASLKHALVRVKIALLATVDVLWSLREWKICEDHLCGTRIERNRDLTTTQINTVEKVTCYHSTYPTRTTPHPSLSTEQTRQRE